MDQATEEKEATVIRTSFADRMENALTDAHSMAALEMVSAGEPARKIIVASKLSLIHI